MKHIARHILIGSSLALVAVPLTSALAAAGADNGQSAQYSDERHDAQKEINEAANVARQMKQDPQMQAMLRKAKGVFIVPDYGRGALIVGGAGGEGVAMSRKGGAWSGPAFYNIGSVSIGAQVGASAGSIAMLLMSDDAVNAFKQNNNFSLNADAGLTIVDYSARADAAAGDSDVVVWSDTEGALANASVGVTDVSRDDDEIKSFYPHEVTAKEILNREVPAPAAADRLRDALSA